MKKLDTGMMRKADTPKRLIIDETISLFGVL